MLSMKFVGFRVYSTDQEWDCQPYPEEWVQEKRPNTH